MIHRNGWLHIKTKIDNKLVDGGLKELKDKIKNSNKEEDMFSFGKSMKSLVRIATIVMLIVGIVKLIKAGVEAVMKRNEELQGKILAIATAIGNLIDGIVTAVANFLEPAITKVVNWVWTLLGYLNAITKAWFGLNLFAQKTDKNLKSSAKSAKEMKNSLAAFDTAQTLGNDSSSGSGDSGENGVEMKIPDGEIPEWVQWIIDHKEEVIAGLTGIAAAIFLVNMGVGVFMSLGIGMIIAGIVMLIQDIINFIKDPSWDGFANILRDLAIILAGVAVAMLAVNAANPVARIILAVAAVVALAAAVIKNWDKIKEVLGKVGKWIDDHIIQPVVNFFKKLWEKIVNGFETAIEKVKSAFNALKTFLSNVITTIVTLFKNIGTKVGNAISGAFKLVINGILAAIENILNFPIKSVNKMLDVINKVPGINISKLSTFSLPRLKHGGIVNQPKTGVNIGGAIAGEDGPEAVIPLTDNTLQKIANMIPITIDLTNTIDGRVLNRRLETIRNNNSFARNGGI